jgi:hypothetical protein
MRAACALLGALQRTVLLQQRVVEHRTLERDRALRADAVQELFVLFVEAPPALFVQALDHRDHPQLAIQDRHAQERARAIAAALIPAAVEARIGVCVLEVEDLRCLRHPARDAIAHAQADGDRLLALENLRPDLAALRIYDVECRAVRLHQLRDLLHDLRQDHVDFLRRADVRADLFQRFELLLKAIGVGWQTEL